MSYAAYRSVRQIRQPKGLMASLALPQELVGALQDRVHHESGNLRAAKSVRIRSDR